MRGRGLLWLGIACLLLGIPGGRAAQADPSDVIKIVSSLPLTGSSRVQSETMVAGIKMALEEAHYTSGKFKIEYSSWDDATAQAGSWSPSKEKENADRAVTDPDVMVYIGTYNSGASKISIPILNQAGLVQVGPAPSYAGLTKPNTGEQGEPELYYPRGFRNFCRVIPADDLQGKAAAWWAASMGVKRVYVLDDKELYGRGLGKVFENSAREFGMTVLGHEGIDAKAPDYRAVMNKIKEAGAQLVYFGGITQNGAGKLVKDLHEVGLDAWFMSPDGTKEQAFIDAAGPAAEGCFVTLGGLPPEQMRPEAQAWFAAYQKKFHTQPEAYAIYSYEATKVVLKALDQIQEKNRDKIREAIMGTKDYDGLLGKWSFDKNGDTTLASISGYRVEGGKFVFKKALEPGKPVPPPDPTDPKPPTGRAAGSGASPAAVLLEQLLTGLSNGALIAVIALGYTLVYGLIELINFAHGDVFMIGGFTALTLVSALGLESNDSGAALAGGLLVSLLGSMLVCGLLNRLIDKLAYRRLRNAPKLAPLITAIGVSFILMNLGGYWRGWAPIYFPNLLGANDFNLFGEHSAVGFRLSQVLVMATSIPLLVGMQLFIAKTRLGKAMRATAQNPEAALLMGIDTEQTVAMAFFLGGALAGAAGLLYGVYNHEVRFDLGFRQGLNAFTAAVLGGIGNPKGAVLGGLIIGLVEALTTYYLAQSLAPAMVFAVLIVIIMFRPSGLLGENVPEKV